MILLFVLFVGVNFGDYYCKVLWCVVIVLLVMFGIGIVSGVVLFFVV